MALKQVTSIMDQDIKREALNHAVQAASFATRLGEWWTAADIIEAAKAFEEYLTGGDAE